jgi:hypothetical protein
MPMTENQDTEIEIHVQSMDGKRRASTIQQRIKMVVQKGMELLEAISWN